MKRMIKNKILACLSVLVLIGSCIGAPVVRTEQFEVVGRKVLFSQSTSAKFAVTSSLLASVGAALGAAVLTVGIFLISRRVIHSRRSIDPGNDLEAGVVNRDPVGISSTAVQTVKDKKKPAANRLQTDKRSIENDMAYGAKKNGSATEKMNLKAQNTGIDIERSTVMNTTKDQMNPEKTNTTPSISKDGRSTAMTTIKHHIGTIEHRCYRARSPTVVQQSMGFALTDGKSSLEQIQSKTGLAPVQVCAMKIPKFEIPATDVMAVNNDVENSLHNTEVGKEVFQTNRSESFVGSSKTEVMKEAGMEATKEEEAEIVKDKETRDSGVKSHTITTRFILVGKWIYNIIVWAFIFLHIILCARSTAHELENSHVTEGRENMERGVEEAERGGEVNNRRFGGIIE